MTPNPGSAYSYDREEVYEYEHGKFCGRVTKIDFPSILKFSAAIYCWSQRGLGLAAISTFERLEDAQVWLHKHVDQPSFLYLKWNGSVLYDV